MRTSIVFLLSLWSAAAFAAETGGVSGARAAAVKPLLEEATVVVTRVDVSRLPAEAVAGKLAKLLPALAPEVGKVLEPARQAQAAFTQAGGRDLYVVVSLAGTPADGWSFVVVPLGERADASVLSELLGRVCEARQKIGSALVGGSKATLQRLGQVQPDPRPDLEAALATAGDAAIAAILLPPKYSGRVIEELMPTLPKELGGGPSRVLTQGVRWAALSVDAVPQAAVRLVIQSQDAAAAQALRGKWAEALGLLAKNDAVRRELPAVAVAEEVLKLEVQQDRLVLSFDEQDPRLAKLLGAVQAALHGQPPQPK